MYVLNLNVISKEITIHKVTDTHKLFFENSLSDAIIPSSILMPCKRYQQFVLINLNLKIGTYKSPLDKDDIVKFIYAETLEDAINWKEWVDSLLILNKISRR